MSKPIKIEVPHKLGQAEARRRVDKGVGQIGGLIPGATVSDQTWNGDTMALTIDAMGQRVSARFEVLEDLVKADLDLPPFLALLGNKFRAALTETSTKLLR